MSPITMNQSAWAVPGAWRLGPEQPRRVDCAARAVERSGEAHPAGVGLPPLRRDQSDEARFLDQRGEHHGSAHLGAPSGANQKRTHRERQQPPMTRDEEGASVGEFQLQQQTQPRRGRCE